MEKLKWVLIGTGIVAVGGVAYAVYQHLKEKKESEIQEPAHYVHDVESNENKPDPIDIFDEVLVDSMDYVLKFSKMGLQTKGTMGQAIKNQLEKTMEEVEKAVCSRNNWDVDEYYAEIERRAKLNDPEILKRTQLVEDILAKVAKGEKPVIEFKKAPELTKRVTLILYKWILISHAYLYYRAVQEELKEKSEIRPEDIQDIFAKKEPEKIERRNELIKKYNVTKKPSEDYRIALQKAYFTYITNDEEFDKQIFELLELYNVLMKLICAGAIIPEFSKDPFELTESELEEVYNKTNQAYAKPIPSKEQGEIEKMLADTDKKPEEAKTLKSAENVESVHLQESTEKPIEIVKNEEIVKTEKIETTEKSEKTESTESKLDAQKEEPVKSEEAPKESQ